MDKFREEMVKEADNATKKNKSEFARGYGGKSGLESEQKDQTTAEKWSKFLILKIKVNMKISIFLLKEIVMKTKIIY